MDKLTSAPFGGLDRREMAKAITELGLSVARADLANEIAALKTQAPPQPSDACVLLLGGSNGILRSLAVQLIFGERCAVHCVHYDSERLQIGPKHAQAISERAQDVYVRFDNADACNEDTVKRTVAALRERFSFVHLVNGIAAGAPKRYAEHGRTQVVDLDVAFDPVRQIADFSRPENVRALGLRDVEVATDAEVERTKRMMGQSTELWANALGDAGLLKKGVSVLAFADYDFSPEDEVYGKGPLAAAKLMQRQSTAALADRYAVRGARLCYPAMNTTALSAIPGALLGYVLTAATLKERGELRALSAMASASIAAFAPNGPSELRLDTSYQQVNAELRKKAAGMTLEQVRARVATLAQ